MTDAGGGIRRLFRLGVGRRIEEDVDDELRFHLEMRTEKLIAAGMPPERARELAKAKFGNLASVRADCVNIDHQTERAMRRTDLLQELRQDVAYAARTLRANPGFTAVVALTLAIGIGANTAIFTLIDAILLRTLPVPHAEQLIVVGDPSRTGGVSSGTPRTDLFSYPLYKTLRDRNQAVGGLLATGRTPMLDVRLPDSASSTQGDGAEHPRGRFVSGNYFAVLQVPAFAGRTFNEKEDDAPGAAPVVVISHGYWQRRFGGDRSVIGRPMSINGIPYTIVGITPPGFTGEIVDRDTDLWLPIATQPVLMPNTPWLEDENTSWLIAMGRLRPGVTLAQSRERFTAVGRQGLEEIAAKSKNAASDLAHARRATIEVSDGSRGLSYARKTFYQPLLTLAGAVGLVLLIVCANVANLMLARSTARGREMAVRMALGAGRPRLIRQLLTESVVLAALGGALAIPLAVWGRAVLLRLVSSGMRPTPLDLRVLAFTAAVSLLTALLFGLMPALQSTRVQLAQTLRAGGRGLAGALGAPGRRIGAGKLLVSTQVALSLILLVATGLLVRSMRQLQHVDAGLARDHLLIAQVDAAKSGYSGARERTFARDVQTRLERLPGVAGVTYSENGIFSGTESASTITPEGFTATSEEDTLSAMDDVGPGYFRTIGARLLRGRDIEASDGESAPKVAVVNETFARFYFKDQNPIGKHFTVDSSTYEIVGVAADVRDHSLREPPERRFYAPMAQWAGSPDLLDFELRTTGDPALVAQAVRRELRAAEPTLTIYSVEPLVSLMKESITQQRLVAQLSSFFGALAIALAAIGLYGVMSYTIVRRTSEFGLRAALGALPADVSRMVLRETLGVVLLGIVVGAVPALAVARLLRHQLFGVSVLDPLSIGVALAVLLTAALLAGLMPAARASRVAPLVALRAD